VRNYCCPFKRISISALICTCLIASHLFAQTTAKPNIIFILGDDIGYPIPTINGGQSYSTPAIDYMAKHGMNFTSCEASPLCSPSRFMFLTGKYNFRNYSNWGYMNEKEKTIANLMHDAGYATGIFGKHQLPYNDTIMHQWGWDYNIVFELTEDTMTYSRYKNPVLKENGYRIPDSVTANKYCDDILTQKIFDFVENNKAKPFFVYYPMSIGHTPYSPTPDDPEFATWNPKLGISDTGFFPSMMHYMDKKIATILNWLHLNGLDKNTIVFYAGDNGVPPDIYYNANGVKHIRGEKGLSTEGGTHVPLIAYWPGHIQQGSINNDLIDFTDLLPTFAEAAQVTKLGKYGVLDGSSFYAALFGQPHVAKQQLFCHYDPHPGFTNLLRWARDKTYKLYDSTEAPRSGNFYNTVNDEKELFPLKTAVLTKAEKQIRQRFLNVLDTIGNWPEAPTVENAYADNITNTSARITATITSKGASKLIDRGSTLARSNAEAPYLNWGRMHDSIVKLGTFSQARKGLFPQTFYRYTLYAMNNNKSHSTGFALGSFYTLSNPPLSQPGSFTASVGYASATLNWNNARFPSGGATNAGYLLVYSSDNIKIAQEPNGKSPSSIVTNGRVIDIGSTVLPNLPLPNTKISDLPGGTYQFLLIPYTWDGLNTSTYNYLITNAIITTATISAGFAFNP